MKRIGVRLADWGQHHLQALTDVFLVLISFGEPAIQDQVYAMIVMNVFVYMQPGGEDALS